MPGPDDSRSPPSKMTGSILKIVFANPENGWTVAQLQLEASADAPFAGASITIVGTLHGVRPGETVEIEGSWTEDPKYGRQFRVERYASIEPATNRGIERYLGSGLVPGIGPKMAKRLVAKFKADTLRVIEEEPGKLHRVPGLGRKRIQAIREAWKQHRAVREVMVFLQTHGISVSQANRIYKKYGSEAIAAVEEDPYRLAREVSGIGFLRADQIAQSLGAAPNAPRRLEAALEHALRQAGDEGHCYLPESMCRQRTEKFLRLDSGLDETTWRSTVESLRQQKKIFQEPDRLYLRAVHRREVRVAEKLRKRLASTAATLVEDPAASLARWQNQRRIEFEESQKLAIVRALQNGISIITGGPGTGKTTLVQGIVELAREHDKKALLCAPTGRAANRLQEATGQEALTLHRALGWKTRQGTFEHSAAKPLPYDLVIVDESSMLDLYLFHHLLQALDEATYLVLVGDIDQLPSVGAGSVLEDLIAAGISVTRLEKIFRQARDSGIVSNAHRIRAGATPHLPAAGENGDFVLVERPDAEQLRHTLCLMVSERLPRHLGVDPVRDIQVLTPMKGGALGVRELNSSLQAALNPNGRPIGSGPLRVGDKVMQMRNNYTHEVFNGDTGRILGVDEEAKRLDVAYDTRMIRYEFSELDELSLAYACTVHKSQGSEYPVLVFVLHSQHYVMLQRNLLYTAVTRARRQVVVLGEHRALSIAIRNDKRAKRYTLLAERIRQGLPQNSGS